MPFRLQFLQLRTAKQCLTQRYTFHTFAPLRADDLNFYEILEIPPNANQSQIKKQFYRLSKLHHPDLHPENSESSQRFIQISTAYATLGNPTKRSAYDRANLPASQSSPSGRAPSGSYSSAQSSPWGGRPASGLSRRRGTFRGPPPSFYRSGGWGAQGEKRRAAQEGPQTAGEKAGRSEAGPGFGRKGGGFSPGQGEQRGVDDDVPHFDRSEHLRRHEDLDERARERIRKGRQRMREELELERGAGDMIIRAVVVVGAIGISALLMPWVVDRSGKKEKRKNEV